MSIGGTLEEGIWSHWDLVIDVLVFGILHSNMEFPHHHGTSAPYQKHTVIKDFLDFS